MRVSLKTLFHTFVALTVFAALANAEVQSTVELTMPGIDTLGTSGAFSVSSVTGPAAAGTGTVTRSYLDVWKYAFESGSGRYGTLGTFDRYAVRIGGLQLLQSFLTPNFTSVVDSTWECPDSTTSYNWILARLRAADSLRDAMDTSNSALIVGGSITYDPNASPIITGSSYFNLTGPSAAAGTYTASATGGSCSNGVVKIAPSQPMLDAGGSLYFSGNYAAYTSSHGSPLVALLAPVVNVTSGTMSALNGNALTGLYTQFTSRTGSTRYNIAAIAESQGTTFTLKSVADPSDPLTTTDLGTLVCNSFNTPIAGFCSGTLTLTGSGNTGKATCMVSTSPTTNLTCVAQNPTTKSTPISIVMNLPERSALAVSFSSVGETTGPSQSNNVTATLTNLSGRKIPTIGNPANPLHLLSAPFSNSGAYAGSSHTGGPCGTTLNAFGTCTVTLAFEPSAYGVFSQTFRVAYDNGSSTVNSTATVRGASGITSIAVTPEDGFLPSSTQQLTATATFGDLSTQDISSAVDWTSSAPLVATVNSTGLATLTALGGAVTFGAGIGSHSGSISPTVGATWGGTLQFGTATGGENQVYAFGTGVATDASNNYYLSGYITGRIDGELPEGTQDGYVKKFNSSGVRQWTRTFGGSNVSGVKVAVDGSGNVYVAGSVYGTLLGLSSSGSNFNYFLIKYDSSGTEQWRIQNGSASGQGTTVHGFAVNGSAIYLSGIRSGAATLNGESSVSSADFYLVKYDNTGSLGWTKVVGPSSNLINSVGGLVVDSTGCVYGTGMTLGVLPTATQVGFGDLFIIKYDATGSHQWTKQWGTLSSFRNVTGTDLAVDSSDNVYVTGQTNGNFDGYTLVGGYDFFLMKVNSSGTKQWTRVLGTSGAYIYGMGISIESDQIYATGMSPAAFDGNTWSGGTDFFLIKYDTSGTKAWSTQIGGGSGNHGNGPSLDVTSSGNVLIFGYAQGGFDGQSTTSLYDAVLVRYNTSGVKQDTTLFSGVKPSINKSFVASDSGAVYLAGNALGDVHGQTPLTMGDTLYVAKYNLSGTRQWTTLLGLADESGSLEGMAVYGGKVYVVGTSSTAFEGNAGIGMESAWLSKIDSNGDKLWSVRIGEASGSTKATSVAITSTGDIFVGGITYSNLDGLGPRGYQDYFIAKYDTEGNPGLIIQNGPLYGMVMDPMIAVSPGGYIYAAGKMLFTDFSGTSIPGGEPGWVVKYDATGAQQYLTSLYPSSGTGYVQTNAMAVNSSEEVYLGATYSTFDAGEFDGLAMTGSGDMLVIKIDSSGTLAWSRMLGNSGNYTSTGGIAVDGSGNVTVVGSAGGAFDGVSTTGYTDAAIIKYNASGTKLWSARFGAADGTLDFPRMAGKSNGDFFLVGTTNRGVDGNSLTGFKDLYVSKFDASGVLQ